MLTHKGTKILETPRLLLRPYRMTDAGAMFERWASDPEVTRFLTWPTHESVKVSQRVLEDWTASYAKEDYYEWAIVLKELDEYPIGSIGVVSYKDGVDAAEVGYCMSRSFWGRGIMPEALGAVIRFLFEDVGCNRVTACHAVENRKSGLVMEKAGMRYEGTMRQAVLCRGERLDCCIYGILKGDR